MCERGATDPEIAKKLGTSVTSIRRWATEHEEFRAVLHFAKEPADDRIVRSLYEKACGFTYEDRELVKLKRADGSEHVEIHTVERTVPPDTASVIFWLKNRRRDDWRDVREFKHDHDFSGLQSADQIIDAVRAKLGDAIAGTLATLIDDQPPVLQLQASETADEDS